jgi:hypothetical protein
LRNTDRDIDIKYWASENEVLDMLVTWDTHITEVTKFSDLALGDDMLVEIVFKDKEDDDFYDLYLDIYCKGITKKPTHYTQWIDEDNKDIRKYTYFVDSNKRVTDGSNPISDGFNEIVITINEEQQYPQQQQQQPHLQANVERKTEPLDPSVKHSFIFNKYFKDYKDPSQPQEEPVYLSPQEYKRQVILEMIRRNQERKRISQIKPKKLLFAQNNPTPPVYSVPTNDINKLFRLSR